MIIKKLKIRNFRNYENENISFDKNLNLIVGKNAQGKTNLLESLVYISLTRSHRISDDRKLIKDECPFADIQCAYEDDSEKELEAIIYAKGKTLLVRNHPVKRSSEFIGLLNVVLFAPDDLQLFTDAPRERRRIMNQEITKISSKYLLTLNEYQNLLRNRNLLLKKSDVDQTLLDTFDEQMAHAQTFIIKKRKEFVDQIEKNISQKYQELSDTHIKVDIQYKCCLDKIYDSDEENYQSILQLQKQARQKDMEYHMTTFGCHHDDLLFEMNDMNLINIASQGQKRMVMLSFKLSLLKYIENETGKKPVLLLDDVLSELDTERQRKLLEMVKEPYQCIITTTDIPKYIELKNTNVLQIENGKITQSVGGMI